MKNSLARLLRRFGWLRFDLLTRIQATYPDPKSIAIGELIVVEDAGIQKWACLKCPGGCGKAISLSLNPSRRPRWGVQWDFWRRPSVDPSVHQKNDCGCHFWVCGGRIDWCQGGRPALRDRQKATKQERR